MSKHFLNDFEEKVLEMDDAIALAYGNSSLSYKELNNQANQLAHYLRSQGVRSNTLVGLCIERSFSLIVGLLAIIKAGGAYVPLDESYPDQRLKMMVDASGINIILTEKSVLIKKIFMNGVHAICIDSADESISKMSDKNLPLVTSSEDLGYVIYTSGSTGVPKGIGMPIGALSNLVDWQRNELNGNHYKRVLQFSPISFDVSFQEIFSTLCAGGTLYLISDEDRKDPFVLLEAIQSNEIQIIYLPYVAFKQMTDVADSLKKYPPSLKLVITAGEQLKITNQIKNFFIKLPLSKLCNQYGPSETHVASAYYLPNDPADWISLPPIGKPITNTEMYLLDDEGNSVAPEKPGEIYIGGTCLAKGYLNQDDLTQDLFVLININQVMKRLYRTGDFGKYSSEGNIEFLGRKDNQVKIRGHRIEVGEVERVLSEHPGVREAVVKAFDFDDHKRLIAYVEILGTNVDVDDLSSYLSQRLPSYMLPSFYMSVKKLPLTPSGKVDRNALPSPDWQKIMKNEHYKPPKTSTEIKMANIWTSVLGIQKISIDEDFFKIGGCSLLATRLAISARESFSVDVHGYDLFEKQTIEKLSEYIDQKAKINDSTKNKLMRKNETGKSPLSFQQQQLWLINKFDPGNIAYNESFSIYFNSDIDAILLEESINMVLMRHEILRTCFQEIDDKPFQVTIKNLKLNLETINLNSFNELERDGVLQNRLEKLVKEPFELTNAPLLRGVFVKHGLNDDRLYMVLHHIIFDGESYLIFMHELEQCYKALLEDRAVSLHQLPINFKDFAYWQHAETNGNTGLEEQYWHKTLDELPFLTLPIDRSYPERPSLAGKVKHFTLSSKQTEGIRRLMEENNTTLFVTLLSAYITLIYRYTGQNDIPVATVISKRNQNNMENLIGYLIDTLILRTKIAESSSFVDLLKLVKKVSTEAYAHQNIPFEKLVKFINPSRRLGQRHNPLAQIAFTVEPEPNLFPRSALGWKFRHMAFHSGYVKYDLYFELEQKGDGLVGRVEYASELFDEQTIDRMIGHYLQVIDSVTSNPESTIDTLEYLTVNEKIQLEKWSSIHRPSVPENTVKEIFEEQCLKNPTKIAISFGEESISYGNLNNKANQLAWHLRSSGVQIGDIVAVSIERSINLVIALLAVVKSNASYAVLDPSYPKERLDYMLDDTGTTMLITETSLNSAFKNYRGNSVLLDMFSFGEENIDNTSNLACQNDILYVIYTSGSTGKPKGIKITNEGIVKLTINSDYMDISSNDVMAQICNASFDGFAFELWGTLLNGAELKIIQQETLLSPYQLKRFILVENITWIVFPTPLFNQLAAEIPDMFKTVRYLLAGGDKMDCHCVSLVLEAGKPEHLINIYGPAESTVFASKYEIHDVDKGMVNIPIGRAIGHTGLYILDKNLRRTAIGVTGEICISGDLLSKGYLNKEELTQASFVPHPFDPGKGEKIYRTRDLGRYLPNGNIEISGRVDQQVKIRGYRVEIDEIYHALYTHPMIKQAYVTKAINPIEQAYLIAYVVLNKHLDPSLGETEFKHFLGTKLPSFMIPTRVIILEHMLLNENGKVDLKSLPVSTSYERKSHENILPQSWIENEVINYIAKLLLLDKSCISMQDNFFDLGGNSLLAVQLISNIGKIIKQPIEFSVLFNARTIRQLSDSISKSLNSTIIDLDMRLLIKMKEGNQSGSILFFMPPAGGQVMVYQPLMRHLAKEVTAYGFRSLGLENGEVPLTSIESIARDYLRILKTIQPKGPYYLIGASAGGIVAYEMAKQLIDDGAQIALLMMIDSPDPIKMKEFQDDLDIFDLFCSTVFKLSFEKTVLAEVPENSRMRFLLEQGKLNQIISSDFKINHVRKVFSTFSSTAKAISMYRPGPLVGAAGWYIKAKELSSSNDFSRDHLWASLIQGLKLRSVSGNHMTLLEEPNVSELAQCIAEGLETN